MCGPKEEAKTACQPPAVLHYAMLQISKPATSQQPSPAIDLNKLPTAEYLDLIRVSGRLSIYQEAYTSIGSSGLATWEKRRQVERFLAMPSDKLRNEIELLVRNAPDDGSPVLYETKQLAKELTSAEFARCLDFISDHQRDFKVSFPLSSAYLLFREIRGFRTAEKVYREPTFEILENKEFETWLKNLSRLEVNPLTTPDASLRLFQSDDLRNELSNPQIRQAWMSLRSTLQAYVPEVSSTVLEKFLGVVHPGTVSLMKPTGAVEWIKEALTLSQDWEPDLRPQTERDVIQAIEITRGVLVSPLQNVLGKDAERAKKIYTEFRKRMPDYTSHMSYANFVEGLKPLIENYIEPILALNRTEAQSAQFLNGIERFKSIFHERMETRDWEFKKLVTALESFEKATGKGALELFSSDAFIEYLSKVPVERFEARDSAEFMIRVAKSYLLDSGQIRK